MSEARRAKRSGKLHHVGQSLCLGANRELMQALPNLKVISGFGVGYETYDLSYAHERGIQIGYTPDVLNDCVADTAISPIVPCGTSRETPRSTRITWL